MANNFFLDSMDTLGFLVSSVDFRVVILAFSFKKEFVQVILVFPIIENQVIINQHDHGMTYMQYFLVFTILLLVLC